LKEAQAGARVGVTFYFCLWAVSTQPWLQCSLFRCIS